MKKINKVIPDKYNDYSILKYLKIMQPNWTKVFSIKMIRTKNVLVNGKRTSINYKLKTGDHIYLYGYSEKAKNLNLRNLNSLDIVYETENLIIVNKPVGITVQSDRKNIWNNMNNQLLKHVNWNEEKQQNEWKPVFIHRLDRNTSGLLIGAKTYKCYKQLDRAMKEQKINKYYTALVHGLVPFKEKTIKNHLHKSSKDNKVSISYKKTRGSKEAISLVKLIKHIMENKESLLEIKLITGRTHQIRAHLSSIGFPIRGDQKYGSEKDKKKYPYPCLKAYKIHFSEDIKGGTILDLKGKIFLT